MKKTIVPVFLLWAIVPLAISQSCLEIHGRAVQYRGDAFFDYHKSDLATPKALSSSAKQGAYYAPCFAKEPR
jgi:hypothetical protein